MGAAGVPLSGRAFASGEGGGYRAGRPEWEIYGSHPYEL